MHSTIIFSEMISLFMMALAGFYCAKRNILNKTAASQISGVIMNVLNPALILNGALNAGHEVSLKELTNVTIVSCVMFASLILIALIYNKIFRTQRNQSGLYSLMMVFSNLGFIGIPIVQSVYGISALIYVSVFILIYSVLLYTFGMAVIQQQTDSQSQLTWRDKLGRFLNPGVYACILAVIVVTMKITPPVPVQTVFSYMSEGAILLSLMMIGVSLSRYNLFEIFLDKRIWGFGLFKMLAVPLTTACVLHFFQLNGVIFGVLLLMISMPVGNMPSLLASEYGADDTICSKGVAVTTLIAVVTLPIVAMMIS